MVSRMPKVRTAEEALAALEKRIAESDGAQKGRYVCFDLDEIRMLYSAFARAIRPTTETPNEETGR